MQRGEAEVPLRNEIYRTDPPGGALIMPALLGNETLGVKLVATSTRGNSRRSVLPPA